MTVIPKRAFFQAIEHRPHEAQWLFHESKARFRIPCCGRRFGKSVMAARDREAVLIVPRTRRDFLLDWIVGPTYDLGEKEFRVLWDDLIVRKRLGDNKKVKRAYNKRSGEMYMEFPWNVRVEVRSATHPETLVGEGLDHVIMSEAAKHNPETWERYIRPALADKRGTADFPTTPEGHNWLYLLWQLGRNPEFEGVYESWNFPSWLNHYVYPEGEIDPEIQLLKLTMSDEEFLQEIAASFASFSGKIYSEFDENVHVQKHVFNPAWRNFICFDWGFTNPFAAIEFQVSPDDRVFIWREHYKQYQSVRENLDEMLAREQPPGYRLDGGFGDAADPEATMQVNLYFGPCVSLNEAKENWREGIDLVKTFLRMRQVGYDEFDRPIEVPGLIVDHSCKNTIREFNLYRKKQTANPLRESGAQGAAQRQDDHALDAIRYGLMSVFKLGAAYHLEDAMDQHALMDKSWPDGSEGYFTSGTVF